MDEGAALEPDDPPVDDDGVVQGVGVLWSRVAGTSVVGTSVVGAAGVVGTGFAVVVTDGVGVADGVAEGVGVTVALGFVAGASPPVGPLGDQNRNGTITATMAAAAAVSVVRRRVRRRSSPMAAVAKSPVASMREASSCRVWRRSSSLGVMP